MTTFIKSNAVKAAVGLLAILALGVAYSANAAYTFTQNLKMGQSSAEVVEVQKFLNSHGYTVATSGAGSAGMESTYYGAKSVAAAKLFQAAQGLPSTGYWGPMSRAAANALGAGTQTGGTLPPGCTPGALFSTTTGQPCTTGGNTQTQTGPVTASLSATNPASGVIVAGQASAQLLNVTFMGNGTVNSVTLKRTGISDQSTLSAVYLYDGVNRLTDGYSFNNAGELTMNGLGLQVSGSRTISVVADVYSSTPSGQTIAVALTSFTAGTTATTVTVQGNVMSVASGSTLASVVNGGSANVSGATVNAGITSYAVWRQSFNVNLRTVWLKAANFRITGSAPADALQNVGLYVDGVKTGGNAMMTSANGSNYLSFDLTSTPASLGTGSHILELRGDVVKGSSFSFTVSLQQASDVMIYDPQVGVNIALCGTTGGTACAGGTANTFTALSAGTIAIGTGSSTVTVDPTFSAMTNITGGASNAVIGKFKVHGYGEDLKVTSIAVTPTLAGMVAASGSTTTLQNLALYFNGSQVGSQVTTATSGSAATFSPGSQMIIPAGVDSTIEIRADIRNSSGITYTAGDIYVTVGSITAEGWNSHNVVTPTGATGTTLSVQTGLLGVAKNLAYPTQTINPNSAGVKIASFVLQNQSSSEGVRVTSLTVNAIGAGSAVTTDIAGLRTSETSGNASIPQQPSATNTFSTDFTVAAGQTKVIDIFADTNANTGVTVIPTLAVTALGSSSNTSISVSAVTGQTMTISAGAITNPPTFITANATASQYVAAGSTGAAGATKATYNFVSTGGTAVISELKFTVSGANTVTEISVNGGTPVQVVSNVAWLQNLNLQVPNGGAGLTIDALVSYAPVGANTNVTPGTTSAVSLTYVKYTAGGSTTSFSPNVSAPTMTMVGSKPIVTVPSTTQSGMRPAADGKLGVVTIAADMKGGVKLNTIVFNLSSSGFATDPSGVNTPRLTDANGSTVSGAACTAAGLVVTCTLDADANASTTNFDGTPLAANQSVTYNLYGTLTGGVTGQNTPIIYSSLDRALFNWDDVSDNGTTGTDLDGTLLYGFPLTSVALVQ